MGTRKKIKENYRDRTRTRQIERKLKQEEINRLMDRDRG